MLKNTCLIFALLLGLNGVANAWTITGKIASGKGTLAASGPATTAFGTFSSHQPASRADQLYRLVRNGEVTVTGYFRAADPVRDPYSGTVTTPAADQLLQVVESDPAYKVSMVVLDGVQLGYSAGLYSVPYNGRSVRALTVYFTRVTYSLVLDKPELGYLAIQRLDGEHGKPYGMPAYPGKAQGDTQWRSRLPGLLPGQWVRVTAVPNLDCQVTRVAGGADIAPDSSLAGVPISRDIQVNRDMSEIDLPSSITLHRWVKAYLFGSNTLSTVNQPVILEARASTNETNKLSDFALNWTASCGTLTDLTPAVYGRKLFTSSEPGSCTVTVTAASHGVTSPPASDTVTFISYGESASNVCLSCHSNRNSELVSGFKASGHAREALTCLSCHNPDGGQDHFGPPADYSMPGSGGVCFQCHRGTDSLAFNGISHFSNSTQSAFVGNADRPRNVCADCHFEFDPHLVGNDPEGIATFQVNGQELADWAASAHGRLDGAFRSPAGGPQFSTSGNLGISTVGVTPATSAGIGQCVRCHTAAGYLQFTSDTADKPVFTNISAVAPAADGLTTFDDSSPLICSACHSISPRGSAVSGRRGVPPAVGFYNVSSAATGKVLTVHQFPALGESDLCIPCHAGYGGNGEAIAKIYAGGNAYRGSLIGSHLAAAGMTVTGYGAYQYGAYSSINSHLAIGVDSGKGPCVGCHMSQPGRSHLLEAVDANGDAVSATCAGCHGVAAYNVTAAKARFAAALSVLRARLQSRSLPTTVGVTPAAWGGDAVSSANNMGAAYNYFLYSSADPAGYVHNPLYAKKAVYDAISWLVNGTTAPGQPGYVTIDDGYIESQATAP